MASMAAEQWVYEQSESPMPTLYNTTDNDPDLRASSGSPSSAQPSNPLEKPDISVLCDFCNLHVDMCALGDHRRYHDALNVMKYKGTARPETTIDLMQRRRTILHKISARITAKDVPLDSDIIHRINDAYEFLKADLEETYEAFRNVKDIPSMDVNGVGVRSDVRCVLAVGMCSDPNARWKSAMEDADMFLDCLGGDPNKAFIGLYDGHHGPYAAARLAEEFHHALLYEMVKFDSTVLWSESIANKAHCHFDFGAAVWPIAGEENDPELKQDGGICTIYQVIRSYEEKLEQLRKQKEWEASEASIEMNSETIMEGDMDRANTMDRASRKSSRKRRYGNAYSEMVAKAMSQAYKHMDLLLSWGREEHSRVRWSGCSAFTAMIEGTKDDVLEEDESDKSASLQDEDDQPENVQKEQNELGRLHLAHAGNVKCVLVRGNKIYRLTRDHTPKNPRERARVEKLGGSISDSDRDVRVNGVISSTRGLGNHGDKLLRACVLSIPYTTVVPIDEHAQFLLVASQGVWEVFSEEEATQILLEMLPSNHLPPPSRIAMSIQYLLTAKSRSHSVDTSHVPVSELLQRMRTCSAMTAASVSLPEHLQHIGPSPDISKRRNDTNDVSDLGDLLVNNLQVESNSQDSTPPDESGNEADIDTCIDQYTIDNRSRISIAPPSPDEVRQEFAKVLAERLVQAAILAGSRDNVTAMVVLLPGCGL